MELYSEVVEIDLFCFYIEKLFTNDLAVCSFFVRLTEAVKQEAAIIDPKKAPAPAKGAKAPEQTDIIEIDMKFARLIKLELLCNEQPILYNIGMNQAVLSCASLAPTRDEKMSYILQCTFDLREWPDAAEVSAFTDQIHFVLSVLSTDTIAVVHDTTKEDRERAIKKSWEDNEAGRAEKAKRSRQKFQLQQRQSRGDQLTEEELKLINEPRITKKQREEQAATQVQAKGAKTGKKDDKKAPVKPGKGVEVVSEVVAQVARVFPKAVDHTANDITKLLHHLESERLSEHYPQHAGLIMVRTDAQQREIVEARDMSKEELVGMLTRNMQMREEIKLFQKYINNYQLNTLGIRETYLHMNMESGDRALRTTWLTSIQRRNS